MAKAAVFLDRDGTLNVDKGYVHRLEDWEWIPGAIDAISAFKEAGFYVIVVTNQAGIARGYYSESEMITLHSSINTELMSYSTVIDKFYHCPHHPEFGENRHCQCRKPKPGMIEEAMRDFEIDLEHSWLIGDKETDIQAGFTAGLKSILVSENCQSNKRTLIETNCICLCDIEAAKRYILSSI